jgi:ParB family chromosome partitioning protein
MNKIIFKGNVPTDQIRGHPKNSDFFDDMVGEKWQDFLQSIKTSGIIEPVVITQDYIVVSGHQRVRAAKELNLKTVPAIIKEYKDEIAVLKDLLETNLRQRGTICTSNLKSAKIAKTLEEIYKSDGEESDPKTQQELAEKLGISLRNLQYIKTLEKIPPELKSLLDDGKVTPTTAIKIIGNLSPDEQSQVIKMLQSTKQKKVTSNAITNYVNQLRDKDLEIARLKAALGKSQEDNTQSKVYASKQFLKLTIDYFNAIAPMLEQYDINDLLNTEILPEAKAREVQVPISTLLSIIENVSKRIGELLFEY